MPALRVRKGQPMHEIRQLAVLLLLQDEVPRTFVMNN